MKDTSFFVNELWDIHWIVSHMKYKYKRRIVFAATEKYFEEDKLDYIVEESMKHRWIESEKVGKDIYQHHAKTEEKLIQSISDWWKEYGHD